MKRIASASALALVLVACGGSGTNPFTVIPEADDTVDPLAVPTGIANDLDSISFNATNQTLVVTGLTQDGTPFNNSYDFVSDGQQSITVSNGTTYNAYVEGYSTFTTQNDAIGRHSTAFVASREGLQAGVVMTGGQFNKFFSGVHYERSGGYVAPTTPEARFDVTYHGNYAAGLNGPGPNTNLKPIVGTLDPDLDVPVQTAYIQGLIFVNVDLNDLSVEGEIFNRTGVFTNNFGSADDVPGFLALPDIVLVEGVLTDNGTFSGSLEVDGEVGVSVGEFAGIIGGPNGEALAGGTNLEQFDDTLENEIEFGVFVLDLCQAGDTDPICVNALP